MYMPKRALLSDGAIAALRSKLDPGLPNPITQVALAGELRITTSMLCRMLSRERGIGAGVASRLSEYCALPVRDVFISDLEDFR